MSLFQSLALVNGKNGKAVDYGQVTPTSAAHRVTTNLSTVERVIVVAEAAPTLTHMFTDGDPSAGNANQFDIISYKPTAAGDVTPIAATTPWRAVAWIAIGVA